MSDMPREWPERLRLRETKVFADEGQEIFTTATGYGYAEQDYIRADLVAERDAEITRLRSDNAALLRDAARYRYWRERSYRGEPHNEAITPEMIDELIDASMRLNTLCGENHG